MEVARFEWDLAKDLENRRKHGVSFSEAQLAFVDACRIIGPDVAHSSQEPRFWRKGKAIYEAENPLHG